MENEEEERQKQEIKKLLESFIDLKTKKELQKSQINQLKVDMQWREILREAKSNELKDHLELLRKSFETSVAYKDLRIEVLRKELYEADVQQMWAIKSHMETMSELIAIAYQQLEDLRQQYLKELSVLKENLNEIQAEVETKDEGDLNKAQELKFVIRLMFDDSVENTKAYYRDKQLKTDLDEIIEFDKLCEKYDPQILDIWKKIQASLLHYMEHGKKMENIYDQLKQECDKISTEAEEQHSTMEYLKRNIPQLKAEVEMQKKTAEERLKKTIQENQAFCDYVEDVKGQILKLEKRDKGSLVKLVLNSKRALTELKNLVNKGEKIIKLTEYCKKLEQEFHVKYDEKTMLTPEEIERLNEEGTFVPPEDLDIGNLKYFGLLENISRKTGKIKLENLAMQREIIELEKENKHLQDRVNDFLKAVAKGELSTVPVKDTVVAKAKPLVQEGAIISKYFSST